LNDVGQLGDATTTGRATPAQITGLANVVAIAAGTSHSLALKSDGTVFAWGGNSWGQLGDATTTDLPTPAPVSGLSNVVAIAAGSYHSLALRSDGTVWSWGRNNAGQLGDGTTAAHPSAAPVANLDHVVAISAAANLSLALRSDHTVRAWGTNSGGQLGIGSIGGSRTTPQQVLNLTGAVAIAAGNDLAVALRSDGTVSAWGIRWNQQAGNGASGFVQPQATAVSGLASVVDVSAAGGYLLALEADGTAWTRGASFLGGLGDPGTTVHADPVQVGGLPHGSGTGAAGDASFAVVQAPAPDTASGSPAGGGTVSTGGPPTPDDPVETAVTTPAGGPVSIAEGAISQAPPSGYAFLGQQVSISAPAGTINNPLTLVFGLDNSLLAFGTDASNIQITKNGGPPIGACDSSGHATPGDPCISQRQTFSGYVQLTVLTSSASQWNLALAKRARIVVVEEGPPGEGQDFHYTAGGGLSPSSFNLDDDGDGTLPNKRVFDPVTPGAGYSITQSALTGWYPAGASCSNGSGPSNITVGPEQTVTCRFVNARGFARPRGASPTRVALVPAYQACTSPNRTHGGPPALAKPSCTPPAQESPRLTLGTADANGQAAQSVGFVVLKAINGNPSTPADEADVKVSASVSDVRLASDLSDYTGALQGSAAVRIVDKLNGVTGTESAALQEIALDFAIPCSATASGSIGSLCTTTTTADALVPDFVSESQRSIWQLGEVNVYDGGPDGSAESTDDNSLFATQGIFVP